MIDSHYTDICSISNTTIDVPNTPITHLLFTQLAALPKSVLHNFGTVATHRNRGNMIYNLEFRPNGDALLIVGENGFRFWDTRNYKHTFSVKAHKNAINVSRFLDDFHFLTASDDRTLQLWDLRKCNKAVRIYQGHRGWIKNIEKFDENTILTSAFDGTVRRWNIEQPFQHGNGNNNNDNRTHVMSGETEVIEVKSNVIFRDTCVARMRLATSPIDHHSKTMIVSLSCGMVLLIKNLDLNTVGEDLNVNVKELGILFSRSTLKKRNSTLSIPNLFFSQRNRLELLQEPSPMGYTTSLQLSEDHKYLLTRQVLKNEDEFTSVFDLSVDSDPQERFEHISDPDVMTDGDIVVKNPYFSDTQTEEVKHTEDNGKKVKRRKRERSAQETHEESALSEDHFMFPNRILFRIPDSGAGAGYIKGPCFSTCGNLILSPYYRSVRLFDFSKGLESLRADDAHTIVPVDSKNKTRVPPLWQPLTNTHNDAVLTVRYHPFWPLFASGGCDGKVNFYAPKN